MEDEVCDAAGCSNCDQVVHHFCSNEIYDGELSVRACSDSCAEVLRASIGAVPDTIGDREISNQASAASSASAARDDPPAKVSAEGKKRKKTFFFTTAADLALLKETLNLRPFAAVHGTKGKIYTAIAEKLGKKFDTKLSERTVKERISHLVNEFKSTDHAYRKKSGPAEDYDEHKQLLTDISTDGRHQRGQGASCITTATSRSGGGSTRGSSVKSANTELAEYLDFQMEIREQEKVRQELVIEIKKAKLNKEKRRWDEDMAFRKAHAEAKEIKWAQELAMRRDEAAIRRLELEVRKEELALLRHQMQQQQ
ncbi:hypothetical protein PHYPSEUDO_010774 [Phytophthora pseudosyringae]|uniref:Uncharacterized protein n=1 Tax=Phytophthora pseudosyringae TaxID=221518 RepID=A0A8T1W7E6_9STRA|nr:hypothetical protein PHYPSEUDO_010774 [Phytophthora pseudosyringae]